jgi:integrase
MNSTSFGRRFAAVGGAFAGQSLIGIDAISWTFERRERPTAKWLCGFDSRPATPPPRPPCLAPFGVGGEVAVSTKPSHAHAARIAIQPFLALGTPRHGNHNQRLVRSYGTRRNYCQALKGASHWSRNTFGLELHDFDEGLALLYLEKRSMQVGQSALNLDRQALQVLLGPLPVIKAHDPRNERAQRTRAYTPAQVHLLLRFATVRLQLPIQLGHEAGFRAEELLTVRRCNERAPSPRAWHPERFVHLGEYTPYTVQGKGGLVRQVAISPASVGELESGRRPHPLRLIDREIPIDSYYDILGGQALSQAFSELSTRVFGWSHGFHGLRHSYAQRRMRELIGAGYTFAQAREIVSQELGHFDPRSMNYYLR